MKISKKNQRLGYLHERLSRNEIVSIPAMAEKFGVTERSVRDDIIFLTHLRIWRSPKTVRCSEKFYYDIRLNRHREAKLDVAETAANILDPTASIAASPGTLVAMTFGELADKGGTAAIFTNSMALIETRTEASRNITITGGEYDPEINCLVGDKAIGGFESKCREGLVGVSGISAEGTLYVGHSPEVRVIKQMLDSVLERCVCVAEISKIGRGDPFNIGNLVNLTKNNRRVVLVTNDPADWEEILGANSKTTKNAFKNLQALAEDNELFDLEVAERKG